jgi:deoxyadenosine/deoxycytidine kinase
LEFRHIALEGPIGVGKSALAERLSARLDATLVQEDADNPFLADFYADKPGAALRRSSLPARAIASRARCASRIFQARSRSAITSTATRSSSGI